MSFPGAQSPKEGMEELTKERVMVIFSNAESRLQLSRVIDPLFHKLTIALCEEK